MRILKWAGLALGGLLVLFMGTLLLAALFLDPNDYRDEIEHIVEQQTSRQFTLAGDLELSVFPWLAVEFGPAQLSDAAGFGDEPFVAVQHARLSIRLWPLLRGAVEIGSVRLDGMIVRLMTDSQGRNNWADLAAADESAAPAAEPKSLSIPTIAGLELRDADISLEDRRDGSRLGIRRLNLKTGRLASGEPFDLASDFLLETGPELSARMEVAARVTPDLERNMHALADPKVSITLLGPGYPEAGLPVTLRARSASVDAGTERYGLIDLVIETNWRGEGFADAGVPLALRASVLNTDLAAQTLELPQLEVDAAGAKFTGGLAGKEILDAPRLEGQLHLAPVSLRDWLPRLGVEVPVTRDPKVLSNLGFDARVSLTRSSADLSNLVLRLDDTTAKGSLGVADFTAQAMRFDLDVDRIDVDRYLGPDTPDGTTQAGEPEPAEIPVEALRKLNARGTLDIGEAVFAGIRLTGLHLGVTARDGNLRLNPAEATVYGGRYRGDVGIAAASDVARITLDQHLSDVDFAPLLKDLFETSRMSGRGSFTSKLTASGRDSSDLMKTLNGTLDFGVRNGAIEGADLWYEIRRARALLRQQAIPARTGPERTAFTALQGSGTVRDGIFSSSDLTIAMQYLRVTGRATIDLPRSEVDSRLDATVLKIPAEGTDTTGMQELVDARVPVRITGQLDAPKVRPDVEGYLKGKVQERLEKEKDKVEEKIRDTLQDRLKRALGGG